MGLRATLAAIQDLGLGQRDIARAAGVNRSQVNRWARGENRPTYDKAMRLAGYLRRDHPELADQFLAATGYGTGLDAVPEPESAIPERLLKAIADSGELTDEEKMAVIAALDNTLAKERGGNSSPASQASQEWRRRVSL